MIRVSANRYRAQHETAKATLEYHKEWEAIFQSVRAYASNFENKFAKPYKTYLLPPLERVRVICERYTFHEYCET